MGDKGVVLFGPWIGEFGWELMTWQAWCREKAKDFDKAYVCSFPDMEPLYRDFAHFIPHSHQGRALDWHKRENIDKAQFEMPRDVTTQIIPFKRYKTDGEFIRFGNPVKGFNYLIHARGIGRGGKDYPLPLWEELCSKLKGGVASIGSSLDHHIKGTFDQRGIPLNDLFDIMGGADCIIGQSSGVMHLACLCGTNVVAWGDSKTYFNETLRERYEKTWNPFRTPVSFIFDDAWKPSVDSILSAIKVIPSDIGMYVRDPLNPPTIEDFRSRPVIPSDVIERTEMVVSHKKYFITYSWIENGKLYHCYKTHDFPTGDLVSSLQHLSSEVEQNEIKKKPVQVIDKETPMQTGIDHWT